MSYSTRVGILGGGQLARMVALAAHPLNIAVSCFDKTLDVPANGIAEISTGDFDDIEAIAKWASTVDVVTYEWENFPASMVETLCEKGVVARPNSRSLAAAQDRAREKELFTQLSIPIAEYRLADNGDALKHAVEDLGLPVIVKTRRGGYDGKGQIFVKDQTALNSAIELVNEYSCVVESVVSFRRELSVIAVRSVEGVIVNYPLTENTHRDGILRRSVPITAADELSVTAIAFITKLMDHLDYVGVLALEMFDTADGLVANEIAPRVHNSGHWTIEGAVTSQFENHIRAVSGLPLGSTELRSPTTMINFVGEVPDLTPILATPGAHVHLYNKSPRPGRKVGHVTYSPSTDEP